MKKKIIISILILFLLPTLIFSIYNFVKKPQYKVNPEIVINRTVWLTETRIYDVLRKSVEEKKLDINELNSLLTLCGNINDNFNGMVGNEIYPRFSNAYIVNDFFLNKNQSHITEEDWGKVEKLTDYYKKIVYEQSILFDNNGTINREALSNLMDLEATIGKLFES